MNHNNKYILNKIKNKKNGFMQMEGRNIACLIKEDT